MDNETCIFYISVSTQEQAKEDILPANKKNALFCIAMADCGNPDYSGSNLNRPGIQKLIAAIKDCDIVLIYKLDRLCALNVIHYI